MAKFKALEKYFPKEEWKEYNDYEKQRFLNMKNNYDEMNELGLDPPLPYFMKPKKRCPLPEPLSSESDEEWSWRTENERGKRKKYQAPTYKSSTSRTAASNKQRKTQSLPRFQLEEFPAGNIFAGFESEDVVMVKNLIKKLKMNATRMTNKRKKLGLSVEIPAKKYPARNVKQPSTYREPDVPDEDHYLLCDDCDQYYEGDCPVHGPLVIVRNVQLPDDGSVVDRAVRTIPENLKLGESSIPGAGKGIFAAAVIAKGIRFGPYEGYPIEYVDQDAYANGYCWQIFKNGRRDHFVDATNANKSNWLRFVNCACHEFQQNLLAFQYRGEIYYRTYKEVQPGEELLVWYGDSYARELGIIETEPRERDDQSPKGGIPEMLEPDIPVEPSTSSLAVPSTSAMTSAKRGRKYVYKEGDEKKRFKCQQCHYASDGKSHLERHMRTHTREKPFACEVCGKRFSRSDHVENHMGTHTGEKPFACEVCGKRFSLSGNVKMHMQTHTGEKPFACEVCGKRFSLSSNVKTHTRTHTGEKPFACEVCGKRFSLSSNVKTHMQTHTGEKPFACEVCGKRFSRSGGVKSHKRRWHSPC